MDFDIPTELIAYLQVEHGLQEPERDRSSNMSY